MPRAAVSGIDRHPHLAAGPERGGVDAHGWRASRSRDRPASPSDHATGGSVGGSRRTLERSGLCRSLGRGLGLGARVDRPAEHDDEHRQADHCRCDQHERRARRRRHDRVARLLTAGTPHGGTASTTSTPADVPRIMPGARPVTRAVTTSPLTTMSTCRTGEIGVGVQHRQRPTARWRRRRRDCGRRARRCCGQSPAPRCGRASTARPGTPSTRSTRNTGVSSTVVNVVEPRSTRRRGRTRSVMDADGFRVRPAA